MEAESRNRCNLWLPKKKRSCANTRLESSMFCGNHSQRLDGEWIPCPIDPSQKLPFQEKHVLQQGSILSNLEEFGVLKRCNRYVECCENELEEKDDSSMSAVIEFGSGRGYLTQMLADC